jgi:hypothetical protein
MGLYICVFDGEIELEGVEVGSYSDYGWFIREVIEKLENNKQGSLFPVLVCHSDCDGEWSLDEIPKLRKELEVISVRFKEFPQIELFSEWQEQVAKSLGIHTTCLYECFFDVDGEPLLERLLGLCDVAKESQNPILFQ